MPSASHIAAEPSGVRERNTAWIVSILGLVLVAAVLRFLAAQGDLWLDEIWSVSLVEEAGSVPGVLFGVSHDNNHYLNSLWLYLVGPDAPVVLQRGLSIVMGIATPLAAGLVFQRDRTAQMAAMLLAAIAAALVHHGSEARGYAGLALFTFLAFAAVARLIEVPGAHNRAALAAATALGILSHLTFVMAIGVAGLWMTVETWRSSRSIRTAERTTATAFRPALFAALAVAFCILVSALGNGGFQVGGSSPFEPGRFIDGYGGMLRMIVGLPQAVPAGLVLVFLGAILAVALLRPALINRRFAPLYFFGLVLVPAAMFLVKLPNTGFSRYFLVSGVVLVIFLADMLGRALRGGLLARGLAMVALAGVTAGNLAALAATHDGRGRYSEAVTLMARDGPFTYGHDNAFRTEMTLGYHARLLGVEAAPVPQDRWCATPPDWLVMEQPVTDEEGLAHLSAPGCKIAVDHVASFPAPTGIPWTIYRVPPQETAIGDAQYSRETSGVFAAVLMLLASAAHSALPVRIPLSFVRIDSVMRAFRQVEF